ncbi:MAG: hypothetical protein J07HX64_01831 [halophilic archaeon J07HX64]|jgi:hypothetical protein|nr:MAG: hypothetical protein J07HX64_01831 [halophilic archaeon J07HX64]
MVDTVDPRGARFGQAVTAALALAGVGLQEPVLVYALAGLLALPVVSRWRLDPYGFAWSRVLQRIVGPPDAVESAVPHRFARLVGAMFGTAATGLFLVSLASGVGAVAVAGYGLAAAVGLLAGLSATTGFCVGCRMYRQVGLFRELGLLTSPDHRT